MPRKRKRLAIQDPNQLLLFSLEEMGGDAVDTVDNSSPSMASQETPPEAGSETTPEVEVNEFPEAKTNKSPETVTNESPETKPNKSHEANPQPQPASSPTVTVEPSPEWMEEDTVDLLKQVIKLLEDFDAGELRLIAMQSTALMQGGIRNEGIYRIPALPDIMLSGNVLKGIAYVSIVQSFPTMIDKIGLHWEKEYEEAMKSL